MAEQLPALIEQGDTATINRMRNEGQAAALAAKKLGYEMEARALARHAVWCTASLGIVERKLPCPGETIPPRNVRAGRARTTTGALAATDQVAVRRKDLGRAMARWNELVATLERLAEGDA